MYTPSNTFRQGFADLAGAMERRKCEIENDIIGSVKVLQTVVRGWCAVRANVLPMGVLWAAAAGAVAAYLMLPAFRNLLEPLSVWQTQRGWVAAFLNRVVFCGILPGIFLITMPSLRPKKVGWVVVAYSLWAGIWGIFCDGFFTLQAMIFGDGHDFMTLVKKTLVDQLVWNVAICTPFNAIFFPWVASGFTRFGSVREGFGPMLVANWIVWLPVMVIVYVFPLPLQIQLVGFAGAIWMLVALRSGK